MYSLGILEKAAMIASKVGWENVDLPVLLAQLRSADKNAQQNPSEPYSEALDGVSPSDSGIIPPGINNASDTLKMG